MFTDREKINYTLTRNLLIDFKGNNSYKDTFKNQIHLVYSSCLKLGLFLCLEVNKFHVHFSEFSDMFWCFLCENNYSCKNVPT